jgi:hypothetical protein
MKNNKLLLYGAVAVGAIFLYNRYAKKPTPQQEEEGGNGGGGGGFGPVGPIGPLPNIPNVFVVNTATPKGGIVTPTTPTNPIVLSGLGGAKPKVNASTSTSTTGGMSGVGVSNTGGIVPISQGGSVTPKFSTGSVSQSQMSTGVSGGMVFKPFDGDMGGLRLENIVRSWNRP